MEDFYNLAAIMDDNDDVSVIEGDFNEFATNQGAGAAWINSAQGRKYPKSSTANLMDCT